MGIVLTLGGCGGTPKTVNVRVREFIAFNAPESQKSDDWPTVRTITGANVKLSGPIEQFRFSHSTGILTTKPPISVYSDGDFLHVTTFDRQTFALSEVPHIAIDYRDKATDRKVAGGILLGASGTVILGSVALMASGGSTHDIVANFFGVVGCGIGVGLFIPGIILVAASDYKSNARLRPTLHVLPNGAAMTMTF